MADKRELFIHTPKMVDIDGRTNIPTVLLYEGNKHYIGQLALDKGCSSPDLLNEDFKIELGNQDPTKRRFETASGHLRSAAGLAKDFIDQALELSKRWLQERGLSMPQRILIAEPLAMGKAQRVNEAWLVNYRSALRRALTGRFDEIDFLPEPFAVFQYYRYGVRHPLVAQKIKHVALVLDFGGGTFDASVIETTAQGDISQSGRNSRPLSAASIPVGGFYVNRLVAQHLLESAFPKQKSELDKAFEKFNEYRNTDADHLGTLKAEYRNFIKNLKKTLFTIESAKIAICSSIANWSLNADLSNATASRIPVPRNPFDADTAWTEVRFDAAMLKQMFEVGVWSKKLKSTIADAIHRARGELEGKQISICLLSGGSSNIRWIKPLIERDLKALLPDAELIELSENFQDIVAKGLAIECTRRFYTDGSGDFRATTYNRLCLALRANDGELEIKRFRPASGRIQNFVAENGVLLPSASVLSGMIDVPLRWKVALSKSPTRILEYYFMKSSFDPDDIENRHNIECRIATPRGARFGSSIEIELIVREDGTTQPRFIYGHGEKGIDHITVEGKPFYMDMTFALENAAGTTYLGFDFGSSNSCLSFVEDSDVRVYSQRVNEKHWLELNELLSVLPYPVSAALGAYIAETGNLLQTRALEAFEAFIGFAAYVAYSEYCCTERRAKTKFFKSVQHRSAGPLWRLLNDSLQALGGGGKFSKFCAQLVEPPFFNELDEAVNGIAAAKHGKNASINYPRLMNILANALSHAMRGRAFGFFENVQRIKYHRTGFSGHFRNAVGQSLMFTDIYEYQGEEPFSSDEVYMIDLQGGNALPLSPLIVWGLKSDYRRHEEQDFFVYDTWREKSKVFGLKSVQFRPEFELSGHGNTSPIFDELCRMRDEDQRRDLVSNLQFRARDVNQ